MNKNTHTRDLARALSRTTDLTYQQAHQRVLAAREAGDLPSVLDDAGMDAALATLQHAAHAPTPSTQSDQSDQSSQSSPSTSDESDPTARRGFVLAIGTTKAKTEGAAVAANLAAYMAYRLADHAKTVVLVDTNVARPDIGQFLGHTHPTIADFAYLGEPITGELIERHLVHLPDGDLAALLGPADRAKASPLVINGQLYRQVLTELRSRFDYVVVDISIADMYHDVFAHGVIPAMDFMALVTLPELQQALNVDAFFRTMASERNRGGYAIDPARLGIVETQRSVDSDEEVIQRVLDQWQNLGRITACDAWLRALNEHRLVARGGFADLDYAFDTILYHITGERAFERVGIERVA